MMPSKVHEGFLKIRKVWPDAELSSDFRALKIPAINLPRQYNYHSTPLLILIDHTSDYTPPRAYVRRDLRIYNPLTGSYVRSSALPEELTEQYLLDAGWVYVCKRINDWGPHRDLRDFVIIVLKFLKELKS